MRKLDWDSSFFKLEVGEIENNDDLKNYNYSNFDLLYVKKSEEVLIPGFRLNYEENKVLFEKEIITTKEESNSVKQYSKIKYNVEEIYDLAYESGKYSRFLRDSLFGESNFKKLYKTWVDNSISKQFADDIFLYFIEDKLVGFVTYKKHSTYGQIGLIAVSKNFQGKGIGRQLIVEVENSLFRTGIKKLRIPTQLENKEACFFYKKIGYKIIESTPIKHYWKIDDTI
ncbi:MAG: GNAT family N-acetyltransferase [Bacteroidota bacterium]